MSNFSIEPFLGWNGYRMRGREQRPRLSRRAQESRGRESSHEYWFLLQEKRPTKTLQQSQGRPCLSLQR